MDSNLTQRRQGLEEKIPDIKKTLTMVEYLQERRVGLIFISFLTPCSTKSQQGKAKANPFEDQGDDLEDDGDEELEGWKKPLKTTFELNDTLYAEAELEETDTVYLWLGVRPFALHSIPCSMSLIQNYYPSYSGKCNAIVHPLRSYNPPPFQTRPRRNLSPNIDRGSGVPERTSYSDGS
jgi:hypothetical protein